MKNVSEHLANERTFLAWLRTAFSLITLGFAGNRFGQYLIEMRSKAERGPPHFLRGTERVGLGMVMLGTLLMVLSSLNYERTRREIDSGDYRAHFVLIWTVGILSFVFGLVAIHLLLQT